MKLVYHDVQSGKQVSPFDEALVNLATKADPLLLASPYIGLSFLHRLIDRSKSWRLISDVEAWLMSSSRKQRARCWEFIVEHAEQIRHVPALHAKVAIGNN